MPSAVPPAFTFCQQADSRCSRDRVNGRLPDRFTGRSRVVRPTSDLTAQASSQCPRLSVVTDVGVRPDRRFVGNRLPVTCARGNG